MRLECGNLTRQCTRCLFAVGIEQKLLTQDDADQLIYDLEMRQRPQPRTVPRPKTPFVPFPKVGSPVRMVTRQLQPGSLAAPCAPLVVSCSSRRLT